MNKKPQIKVVFFDMGGVLIKDTTLKENAFRAFNITDRESFWKLFNDIGMAACRGEEPLSECWKKMSATLGIPISDQVAKTLWIENFETDISIDKDIMNIIINLKTKYRLGVVSNTIQEHADILRRMGVYAMFEQVLLSHELGITKDNPAIFDQALERIGLPGDQVVFIDDVEKFAKSAASRGLHAIVYKSPEQLRRELGLVGVDTQPIS